MSDNVRITYDANADTVDIELNKGKYHLSAEMGDDVIFAYTKEGDILNIEVLNASKRFPKEVLDRAKKL